MGGLPGKATRPRGDRKRDGRFIENLSVYHLWGGHQDEELVDGEGDDELVDPVAILDRLLSRIPPPLEVVVRSTLAGEQQKELAKRMGFAQSTVSVWQNHASLKVLQRVASLNVDLTPAEVFDHVHEVVPKLAKSRPRMALFVMEYWRWHSTAKVAKALGVSQMTVWCSLFDKTGFVNSAPVDDPVVLALREIQSWGGFNGLR